MPTLDMRRPAVEARQDFAYALSERGLTQAEIAEIIGWSPNSDGIRRAIRAGEQRALSNRGRTSGRKFGIEIEFFGTSRSNAQEEIGNLDSAVQVAIEGYNHHTREHWKLVTDASVNSRGTGEGGLECVSPILEGEQGFAQLRTVVKGIKAGGGRVDRTCGLHVHHDARDMTGTQLAWMLEFYVENQTVIDSILAPSRRSTSGAYYCQPWQQGEKRTLYSTARMAKSSPSLFNDQRNFPRYRTVNVQSYAKYGTIEFRQHQGSLNPRKIAAWVRFGQAMMETAMASDGADVPRFTSIQEMTNHLTRMGGLPGDVAEYLCDRAEDYAEATNN